MAKIDRELELLFSEAEKIISGSTVKEEIEIAGEVFEELCRYLPNILLKEFEISWKYLKYEESPKRHLLQFKFKRKPQPLKYLYSLRFPEPSTKIKFYAYEAAAEDDRRKFICCCSYRRSLLGFENHCFLHFEPDRAKFILHLSKLIN